MSSLGPGCSLCDKQIRDCWLQGGFGKPLQVFLVLHVLMAANIKGSDIEDPCFSFLYAFFHWFPPGMILYHFQAIHDIHHFLTLLTITLSNRPFSHCVRVAGWVGNKLLRLWMGCSPTLPPPPGGGVGFCWCSYLLGVFLVSLFVITSSCFQDITLSTPLSLCLPLTWPWNSSRFWLKCPAFWTSFTYIVLFSDKLIMQNMQSCDGWWNKIVYMFFDLLLSLSLSFWF